MEGSTLKIVREFNRFFTAKLNVFDRFALGTSYSLVEGRIIGEIGRNEGCTAINIAENLNMDKSYLSRILAKLDSYGLLNRIVSFTDSRKKHLSLTKKGRELFEELELLSDKQAENMLSGLSNEQVGQLLKSMCFIQSALGGEYQIISAYNHLNDVRELFQEYITQEYIIKRGVSLEFQHIDQELKNLPGEYKDPTGGLFLAYWQGNIAGCGAFRKLDHNSCEFKRLYVREAFRGHKLGQRVLSHMISEAKKKGYVYAYCDTLSTMTEAIALYHKMGFTETEPYYNNPLQGALYLRKEL